MKIKNQKGFTLIEILIVVAIIGMLASIVLVGLGSFRSRGRDARRIADLRQTQNALELYYTKKTSYPPTQPTWPLFVGVIKAENIGVANLPNDPLTDRTYSYAAGTNNQSYVLKAILEDASNPALNDDVDGSVYNLSCDDPAYCVQF